MHRLGFPGDVFYNVQKSDRLPPVTDSGNLGPQACQCWQPYQAARACRLWQVGPRIQGGTARSEGGRWLGRGTLGGGRVNLGLGGWRGPAALLHVLSAEEAARRGGKAREFQKQGKKETDNLFAGERAPAGYRAGQWLPGANRRGEGGR